MNRLKQAGAAIHAAGAMSGTSLDGVDIAAIETDGLQILGFGETAYRAYTPDERAALQRALGQWAGPEVDAAGRIVDAAHKEVLAGIAPVDVIGYHGQTLAHAPRAEGTLQVGDGQGLANAVGRPVVWDFRTADVALGGEGAPLAPFYHWAAARWAGLTQPVAFLNLGGVGNITWVDPAAPAPEASGALLAFDTGPANAPIDDFVRARCGAPFDRDGRIAAQGAVEPGALELFLAEAYFARLPPKSLDRNDFSEMVGLVSELSEADAVATLTGMSAAAVAQGMQFCPKPPGYLFVTGGGRKNPVLMEMLKQSVDCPVAPVEDLGLDGDMLEAQAFAYLAVRVARGLPTSCPSTTGVKAAVGGGVLSMPADAVGAA